MSTSTSTPPSTPDIHHSTTQAFHSYLIKNKFYVIEGEIEEVLKGFPGHEIEHIRLVMEHTYYALLAHTGKPITSQTFLEIMLSAFLHEVDDMKIFPTHTNYENARKFLRIYVSETNNRINSDNIIRMISLVSATKNGDTIPDDIKATNNLEFLYPRYADRLEALGWIGVYRCLQYAVYKNRPMFDADTPKPQTETEMWEKYATPEHYKTYHGYSKTFLDHFYDKMLRLGKFEDNGVRNSYLIEMAKRRMAPMIQIALEYSQTGKVREDLEPFLLQQIQSEKPDPTLAHP